MPKDVSECRLLLMRTYEPSKLSFGDKPVGEDAPRAIPVISGRQDVRLICRT